MQMVSCRNVVLFDSFISHVPRVSFPELTANSLRNEKSYEYHPHSCVSDNYIWMIVHEGSRGR